MQFEFKEEDILRLANEIDNRAEYPEIYPDPIVVKFSGDFASFSRPEFRVEKMTYKVPTFSPSIRYILRGCVNRNPTNTASCPLQTIWAHESTMQMRESKGRTR